MSLKRPAATDISFGTTTVETKDDTTVTGIPPLKLRIKEPLSSSTHKLISDISSSVRLNERLNSLLRLSSIPTSGLNTDDGEQLAKVLKEVLRKEDNHGVKGRIILAIRDVMKIPNLSRLVNMDDLVDMAQKEGMK